MDALLDLYEQVQERLGLQLPSTSSEEARSLRQQIAQRSSGHAKSLGEVRAKLEAAQTQLEEITKSFEKKGLDSATTYDDAWECKYLSTDILKYMKEQVPAIEELVDENARQYSIQSRETTAATAMLAAISERIRSGNSYGSELRGFLSFQKLASLADPDRPARVDHNMLHKLIKEQSQIGLPSASQLQAELAKTGSETAALYWQVPRAGLAGEVLQNVVTVEAVDGPNPFTRIAKLVASGQYQESKLALKQWQLEHPATAEDRPNVLETKARVDSLGKQMDRFYYGAEFRRYLRSKVLAEQTSLLLA
eukprot:NODE_4531_length_1051_cov_6.770474_g4329_i0.p1 GENE.NODE_4531_length_1051_cov_6.770474_g4329_i0~~NODE_4531_length_1051_cov_6.770474_g4329_i0.p1  ORF type:complete len:331 (+),score=71.68 NODE_4531_length_1051_cov_6.770474_g4329_i0:71-994(+)